MIVAGNWKLHKSPKESREFLREWKTKDVRGLEIAFFPPATSLEAVGQELQGTAATFGPQNIYFEASGAFTGENSPAVARGLGATWALVGHSERRTLFGETDSLIAKKVQSALKHGLKPMLCIGETLDERRDGKTERVLERQLTAGLELIPKDAVFAVAYEPVWAIGTGQVAGPDQVREAHAFIVECLKRLGFSARTPILYGGSVKPDNAGELSRIPHVGGFLVGGASLDVSSFLKIVHACQTK